MLRFDLPQVWSNVTRWEAFLTFLFCLAALGLTPWVMAVPAVQGLLRGFAGHYRDPAHRMWARLLAARQWGGRKENPGAKMFASKLLCIGSTVVLVLAAFDSPLWPIPCVVLLVFSFLEWAFSFCAGCWAYGAWYRAFPPRAP